MGPRYGKCENVKVVQTREIRDLITGSKVEISNPDAYELETVLIDSAYYKYRDKEFRFLLCQARESGLKIA
ncbi:MAG TPA: hypothetical protein VLH08_13620 [Acidobacteriota bacterium]|nr:hypothetical protein [Acidobacteriota bacterium]